jgi:multidrug efflux pump subunit AcrA (membrane-fusion protein)
MNDREMPSPTPAGASPRPPTAAETSPGEPSHEKPPGADLMNVVRWVLFAGLLALAGVTIGSYVMTFRSSSSATKEQQRARYYCPMHPSYTSDRPGECPICGMSLEPIPAGGAGAGRATGGEGDVPGLTTVHISPERIQLIGVRTARVQRRPLAASLDLVGFVAPDETRLKRVQIRAAGWVQTLHVNRVGQSVSVGQPLLTMYSPELYQSEQEYVIAVQARDTTRDEPHSGMGHEVDAAASALTRLVLLGVPPEEIQRLDRVPVALPRLTLRATVAGTVLERNVTQGQYVAADVPLYTIADLSEVWVIADLYEQDFARVRVGDRATFTVDALPGREFKGTIEFVYPTVSSETRTLKVRLSLANRDQTLKPGMYGRVRVAGRASSALAVPGEAVVNTGEHQYVFLARADGHFEPRMVWTGARDGDWVQVLRGVAEGDTVVSSASFLVDSESRLKAAIAGMGSQPQTGHRH